MCRQASKRAPLGCSSLSSSSREPAWWTHTHRPYTVNTRGNASTLLNSLYLKRWQCNESHIRHTCTFTLHDAISIVTILSELCVKVFSTPTFLTSWICCTGSVSSKHDCRVWATCLTPSPPPSKDRDARTIHNLFNSEYCYIQGSTTSFFSLVKDKWVQCSTVLYFFPSYYLSKICQSGFINTEPVLLQRAHTWTKRSLCSNILIGISSCCQSQQDQLITVNWSVTLTVTY